MMVIGSDKNLGQCVIERALYHELVFNQHLGDKSAYDELTKDEADKIIDEALEEFWKIYGESARQKRLKLSNSCFSQDDITYIQRTLNLPTRHSQFYALAKVHKGKTPMPMRPVVGSAGSKLFSVSKMVDKIL